MGWHMKQDRAPILFYDNDKPAARAKRTDPVAAAARSNHALTKAFPQTTNDDYTVHSLTSLLADLDTVGANHYSPPTTCQHSPRSPCPPNRSGLVGLPRFCRGGRRSRYYRWQVRTNSC